MLATVKRNDVSTSSDDDRWQAVLNRDRGRDGEFVFAVSTTGIYCRPSCPARRPHRENVELFAGSRRRGAVRVPPLPALPAARGQHATGAARGAGHRLARCPRRGAGDAAAAGRGARRQSWALAAHVQPHRRRLAARVRGGAAHGGGQVPAAKRRGRDECAARGGVWIEQPLLRTGKHDTRHEPVIIQTRRRRHDHRTTQPPPAHSAGSWSPPQSAASALSASAKTTPPSRQASPRSTRGRRSVAMTTRYARRWSRCSPTCGSASRSRHFRSTCRGRRSNGASGTHCARFLPGSGAATARSRQRLGNPGAARAVAGACAANPAALVIPCHRVVRADGGSGGYRWGAERKRALLAAERG